ncbi:class II aldolase/adducin family protein [Rubrobacter marinus]|uniref:Class II aldolase/adducin family protein n=1 Tax=Rubrobacter marinus TaxID=2653852 RepID=A0A6G8Q0N8_9ACTN|nr:class II aldolase/adducin family protein [Rubrobacter marinus]QIN79998.1 class II aldolase/adducin family protein [Rubrobacter marinus]
MREEIFAAARSLSAHGLVTAFGHASARQGADAFLITPPVPLGSLWHGDVLHEVSLDRDELPEGVPGEVWVHWAIYNARPELNGICRAQPPVATALASAGVPIKPLHGQGAFVGREVPVYEDARLIRGREAGEALAKSLGSAHGVIMRGNGAVTVGESIGAAVSRMWVLERSAEINRDAASAGTPRALDEEEFAYWDGLNAEILPRIWRYLKANA